MKKNPKIENCWRPQYPEPKDQDIRLIETELEIFIPDRPVIFVKDVQLENPACFWIDKDHFYLRINWSAWTQVNLSDPDQTEVFRNAVYCKIAFSPNNTATTQVVVPIYHIAALPKNVRVITEDPAAENDEYKKCIQTITQTVHAISDDLKVYEKVTLGNEKASAAIASDSQLVILDVLPEDRNFIFTPADGKEKYREMVEWQTDEVSLDFIEKLRRLKKDVREQNQDSCIDIGLLANELTIAILRVAATEDISDLKLFTYNNLKKELAEHFSETVKIKEENIAEQVRSMIALIFKVDPSKVRDDTVFLDDLHAKMLDIIALSETVKDVFGCIIPIEEIERFRTVKDIIDFIEEHQS